MGEDGGPGGVAPGYACASPLYSLPMCQGVAGGRGAGGSRASRAGAGTGERGLVQEPSPALPPSSSPREDVPVVPRAPGGLSPPRALCPGRRRLGRSPFRVGGCSGAPVLAPSPSAPQTRTTRKHQRRGNLGANRRCRPRAEALESSPAFWPGWRQRVLPWLLPGDARGRARAGGCGSIQGSPKSSPSP